MSLLVYLLFFSFCIIQSTFGVGLLLLGTPTFLLLGYDFFTVLNLLLPYSITISFFQIIHSKLRDYKDYSLKLILISIPCIALGILFIKYFENTINFKLFISLMIISLSILNLLKHNVKRFILNYYDKSFAITGIVHGLTNLGGSILSLIILSTESNKNHIRTKIAIGYLIFGITQLLIIQIFEKEILNINLILMILCIVSLIVTKFFFYKISNIKFSLLLNIFMLVYGLYIIFWNIII